MIDLVLLAVLHAASGAAGLLAPGAADALPRRRGEHLLAGGATGPWRGGVDRLGPPVPTAGGSALCSLSAGGAGA